MLLGGTAGAAAGIDAAGGAAAAAGAARRAVSKQRATWRAEKPSRSLNLILLALNLAGMVVAVLGLEVAYVPPPSSNTSGIEVLPSPECDSAGQYKREITLPLCAVNLGISLLSWIVLARYYTAKYSAQCRVSLLPRDPLGFARDEPPPFWRGHMLRGFVVELVLLGVQPVPWASALWFELLSLLVGGRIYLALRALRDFAKRRAQRDAELHNSVRRPQLVPALSWRVALKLLYQSHPLACIGATFAYSFVVLSFLIHIVERGCNPAFVSFGAACWLTITTMTTVGYGDLCPRDPLGQLVASIACVWGIVLLALVCLVVTDHLSLKSSEARLLRMLQQRELDRDESEVAAHLIQEIWRTRLPHARLAGAEAAAAALESAPAARRRLGLTSDATQSSPTTHGSHSGGDVVAAGGSGGGGRGGHAVGSLEAAASDSSHRRLHLLHRLQKQRQTRLLFNIEEAAAPGEALLLQRLDSIERTVAVELAGMRAAQAAQSEVLSRLSAQLAQLGAPPPPADHGSGVSDGGGGGGHTAGGKMRI